MINRLFRFWKHFRQKYFSVIILSLNVKMKLLSRKKKKKIIFQNTTGKDGNLHIKWRKKVNKQISVFVLKKKRDNNNNNNNRVPDA